MDTPVGIALASVSTSAQWSTLGAVLNKMNTTMKKAAAQQQRPPLTHRELDQFLQSVGDGELQAHGIWRQSFGRAYMPILLVNPAYARSVARTVDPSSPQHGRCSCPNASVGGTKSTEDFQSQAYNAGRHALRASRHVPSCPQWQPPSTGHLHSWRRGFDAL